MIGPNVTDTPYDLDGELETKRETTFGACACPEKEPECLNTGDYCDKSQEYYLLNEPRYKHHLEKHKFSYKPGGSPFEEGKQPTLRINDRCGLYASNENSAQTATNRKGPVYDSPGMGWDIRPQKLGLGCERILMDFDPGASYFETGGRGEPQKIDNKWRNMEWAFQNEHSYWLDDQTVAGRESSFPFTGKFTTQRIAWDTREDNYGRPVWDNKQFSNTIRYPDKSSISTVGDVVYYRTGCKKEEEDSGINIFDDMDEPPVASCDPWCPPPWFHDSGIYINPAINMYDDHVSSNIFVLRDHGVSPGTVINVLWDEVQGDLGLLPVDDFGITKTSVTVGTYLGLGGELDLSDDAAIPSTIPMIYIFGGVTSDGGMSNALWTQTYLNDMAVLHLVEPTGDETPQGLRNPITIYDASNDRILLLGGEDAAGNWVDETWTFSATDRAWSRLEGNLLPEGLADFAIARQGRTSRVWIYGGQISGVPQNELYSLDLPKLKVTHHEKADKPPALLDRSMVYHPVRDSLVVFGGHDQGSHYGDLWEYSFYDKAWHLIISADQGLALARSHALLVPSKDAGSLTIAGGYNADGPLPLDHVWVVLAGDQPILMDTPAGVSLLPCSGTVSKGRLFPGITSKKLEMDFQRGIVSPGRFINLHVTVPSAAIVRVDVLDSLGQVVGHGRSAAGEAVVTVLTQDGEKYDVYLTLENGAIPQPFTARLSRAEATRVTSLALDDINDIALQDGYAYVVTSSAMKVLTAANGVLTPVASLAVQDARGIVVDGKYAYVVEQKGNLVVVDISQPTVPRKIATEAALTQSTSIAKYGNTVFLGAGWNGVEAIDVSMPQDPTWKGMLEVDGDFVSNIEMGGNMVMAATMTGRVALLSAAALNYGELVSTIDTTEWIEGMALHGNRLYVLTYFGEVVEVDLTSPYVPKIVDTYDAAEEEVNGQLDGKLLLSADDKGVLLSNRLYLYAFSDSDTCPTGPDQDPADVIDDTKEEGLNPLACVIGAQRVWVGDRANVKSAIGSNGYVEIGVGAIIGGKIEPAGSVLLRERAVVQGDVIASGTVSKQNGVVVTGVTRQYATVTPVSVASKTVSYGTVDVIASASTGCNRTIYPGYYRSLMVHPNCTLTLMGGGYNVKDLYLYADGDLKLTGPVKVNAAYQFQLGDRSIVSGVSSPEDFVVYTNQNWQVRLGVQSTMSGVIIAPYAEVDVTPNAAFQGCVQAAKVLIDADAQYVGLPAVDVGGTPPPVPPTVPPATVTAALALTSDWNVGYCATVTLTNHKTTATATWTVVLDAKQSTINNLWDGQYTRNGSRYTVTSMSYNGAIPAGGTKTFGFCANKTGTSYQPEVVSVAAN